MDVLQLRTADGAVLAVPAHLDSTTTYVLLEQEAWFEKETEFLRRWLRPGMTAIDIGASYGVYSLPTARSVAPGGRVFAYEPASEPRALLKRSRELNGAGNLEIIPLALSDGEREGLLVFGDSSESNALGQAGAGEPVRVTSLDAEDGARGWPAPDFVKIDAEGEEERIVAGGRAFFARHSPLVMIEVRAGQGVNEQLRSLFPAMGYRLYRALAGAPVLVPLSPQEPLDRYELNLFAAKPDRAAALAQSGFLVEEIPPWEPREENLGRALALPRSQAFVQSFAHLFDDGAPLDPEYRKALAGYAVWRTPEVPLPVRCAALAFAFRTLQSLCSTAPSTGRWMTLARVAWDWGARRESVAAVAKVLDGMREGGFHLGEPFWPACPRFDAIAPGEQPGMWFAAAAAEQFERAAHYSSMFAETAPVLEFLCGQPFASAEMERRRVLRAARAGQRPVVPPRLRADAPDHRNAELWRAGKVPGTAQAG